MKVKPEVLSQFRQFLKVPEEAKVESLSEGNIAHVIKVTLDGFATYYKLNRFAGPCGSISRGTFFIKHLPTKAGDDHSQKRRHLVRRAIEKMDGRLLAMPVPVMGSEMEVTIPNSEWIDRSIHGLVITAIREVPGKHFKTTTEFVKEAKVNDFDPIFYSKDTIQQIASSYFVFQENLGKALSAEGEIREADLVHEEKGLKGLPTVNFSRDPEDLKSKVEELQTKIEQLIPGVKSLKELQDKFLEITGKEEDPTPPIHEGVSRAQNLPFNELVFNAEKNGLWNQKLLDLGRKICLLTVADEIINDLKAGAIQVKLLEEMIHRFSHIYPRLLCLPEAPVHQDPHPFIFLASQEGAVALLGNEDISWDKRIADISSIYAFKVTRGLVKAQITSDHAVELLRPFTQKLERDEIEFLGDYQAAMFLNHFKSLQAAYSLDLSGAVDLNLAVSLSSFLMQMELVEKIADVYREVICPKLV